jgi:iron(III) transport system ATP-binding protein
VAVQDVDLDLEPGGLLAILGPSGCGKTTCLRLIAGFERPDRGVVEVNGQVVASPSAMVPPERRRVGMVFQDLALFPHLTVRENVTYGIRRAPDRRARADELLELVGLAGDALRYPHELSGGMQQRVALARALAPRPDVLLLDEPFSSLDRVMRTQLRGEVREILRAARQSAIFVTHDQGEALTMADRVAVMTRGRVLQVASPEIIYAEPATPFVATFIGVANLVHAEVRDGIAATRFGPARLVGSSAVRPLGAALCLLRPEHFSVREADGGATDRYAAPPARGAAAGSAAEAVPGASWVEGWEVVRRSFSGSEILLEVRAADGERIWVEAGDRVRNLGIGDRVALRLRAIETVAFGRRAQEAERTTAVPAVRADATTADEPGAGVATRAPVGS